MDCPYDALRSLPRDTPRYVRCCSWDEVYHSLGPGVLDPRKVVINTRFNPKQSPARVIVDGNATQHGFRVVRSENIHWYGHGETAE